MTAKETYQYLIQKYDLKEFAFLLTLWNPMGDMPYILDVQPVPDNWYDKAKNAPEDIPEEYGKNM